MGSSTYQPQKKFASPQLRELLQNEQYPLNYVHKFIGRKTDEFFNDVGEFESKFTKATRVSERESAPTGENIYVALTYTFEANSADEVIEILEAASALKDLKIIL